MLVNMWQDTWMFHRPPFIQEIAVSHINKWIHDHREGPHSTGTGTKAPSKTASFGKALKFEVCQDTSQNQLCLPKQSISGISKRGDLILDDQNLHFHPFVFPWNRGFEIWNLFYHGHPWALGDEMLERTHPMILSFQLFFRCSCVSVCVEKSIFVGWGRFVVMTWYHMTSTKDFKWK